jgi:hypothetical protein
MEQHVARVHSKVVGLDFSELNEWKEIVFLKLRQLLNRICSINRSKSISISCTPEDYLMLGRTLRETLYTLVVVCLNEESRFIVMQLSTRGARSRA